MRKGKCRPVWIFALLLAFPVCSLFAQPDSTAIDSTQIAKHLYLKTCAQGIQVMVLEDTTLPLVRIQLTARAGTDRQKKATEGIVHLQEALFFKAQLRGDTTAADLMREAGILMQVSNGIDYSGYKLSIGDGDWQSAMEKLVPCLRLPTYGSQELEQVRSRIAKTFQEAETNPLYYLDQEMNQALWSDQSPRKNGLGQYEIIYRATLEELTRFHDQYYYPENCLLAVTGSVNHEEVFAKVDTLFEFWEAMGGPPAPTTPFPDPEEKPYFFVENELVNLPLLQGGWKAASLQEDSQGALAGEILANLLNRSGGKFQEAMVGSGFAVQALWSFDPTAPSAPLELSIIPDPRRIDKCMDQLHKEVDRLCRPNYFTTEEVTTANQRLTYDWRYRREISTNYLAWLSGKWASGNLASSIERPTTLEAIELAQLKQFIDRYIKNQPLVMGMLVSSYDKEGLALESVFTNPQLAPDTIPTGPPPPPFDLAEFRINFIANSMTPDFESRIRLSGLATKMKAHPEACLYVDGHTDSYGSPVANQKLSQKRADAIVEYLTKFHKLPVSRFVARGLGESQPEVKERTEKDRAQNRRVVFTFIDTR